MPFKLNLKDHNWTLMILRSIMALGIAFFLVELRLDYLESFFYDLRVRLRPSPPPVSHQIATITIDPQTQIELERQPNVQDHILFLKKLKPLKPKAIIYVLNPTDITGSYKELEAFARLTKTLPFYAVSNRLPQKGVKNDLVLPPPLDQVPVASGPTTSDSKTFAKDGVTRRLIVSFFEEPLLHMKLASSINGLTHIHDYKGVFKFKRTTQAYINYHPTGTYPAISMLDVLKDNFDPNALKNKIIFFGQDTKANIDDYVMTPYSRDVVAMSKTELHANILDTLILNQAPSFAPYWLDLLITALIAILTVNVVLLLKLRPTKGLLVLGAALIGFLLLSWMSFSYFNYILNMTHPLLAVFICYYFFIPYRLIMENRKSWEYYKKNELLTQVEELKSNFLRMMSHDLKTPLARIQGMTDVVLRSSEPLKEEQKKALQSISKSTEELSKFIGSILSLGRIESKEIKLHLRSKDINTLIAEVIHKCEYLAQQKEIEIIPEFEPMFSIRIDEDLMRQVLTNLIENAIKYSPPRSKVLITTEEINGKILIQVADQGIGIPKEEQENIFTKFYRSKDVQNKGIKGSGLGLYLSKYFVTLHQGKLEVDSEPQRGSTFSIILPTDPAQEKEA
ncbi:MAG: CHASE2 domain-containing protein [Bdellovibrio sp.]|nr:MAG: CHASE2 domain-containing protein [Bdellovibrio sp.]